MTLASNLASCKKKPLLDTKIEASGGSFVCRSGAQARGPTVPAGGARRPSGEERRHSVVVGSLDGVVGHPQPRSMGGRGGTVVDPVGLPGPPHQPGEMPQRPAWGVDQGEHHHPDDDQGHAQEIRPPHGRECKSVDTGPRPAPRSPDSMTRVSSEDRGPTGCVTPLSRRLRSGASHGRTRSSRRWAMTCRGRSAVPRRSAVSLMRVPSVIGRGGRCGVRTRT
jgi:hypothetical protein